MRQTVALALLICLLVADDCLAQVIDTSDHSIWLKENAVAIQSIDPEDEDFSDLEPLKQLIGDARVVGLGEQTHGDGATFHAKTRLIKFLHQEMGFDVLVWESGMYDCHIVEQAVDNGESMKTAWRKGIFPIWGMSEQVQPLFEYVDSTRKTARPLLIAGCDCQVTGAESMPRLRERLSRMLDRIGSVQVDDPARKLVDTALARQFADIDAAEFKAAADSILHVLAGESDADHNPAVSREVSLLRRALQNAVAAGYMSHWFSRDSQTDEQRRANRLKGALYRESALAKTLIWLAKEYYADRKLIVWAASSHLTYNSQSVELRQDDGSWSFDHGVWAPMGNAVHDALGDDFYVIDFLAYSGPIGSFAGFSRDLDPAPAGSIDAICHATGRPFLFVDLKTLPDKEGGQWLRDRLVARPRGYAPMRTDWSGVCDAFVFTDQMYPSTLTKTEPK